MPHAVRPRRLFALATGNWLSRGYLAVLAASVVAMFAFPEGEFGLDPMTLTAPVSFLGMAFPFGPGTEGSLAVEVLATGFWVGLLLLGALGNAAALGALASRSADAPPRRRARALLAPAVDNWLARGYLAVVAAAIGVFLYAVYLSPNPGFAAIWPLMATAPLSILTVTLSGSLDGWLSSLVFTAGTALAGLCNAVLLGRLARAVRG
ncbi:SCO4225 family membrane protein [Streptomyces sp. NPDC048410]|uniref:SCO4225 family membrane protein n=1 Tax=Streptomyces sp. NPDC048410 TaxID=3365545 RepID=UPI003713B848